MPYITPQRRELVATQQPPKQGVNEPLNVGELTYQLTVVIEEYRRIHGTKYQIIAEIRGALESAKDEFGRRIAHDYEDGKLAANGDVYADVELPPQCRPRFFVSFDPAWPESEC